MPVNNNNLTGVAVSIAFMMAGALIAANHGSNVGLAAVVGGANAICFLVLAWVATLGLNRKMSNSILESIIGATIPLMVMGVGVISYGFYELATLRR